MKILVLLAIMMTSHMVDAQQRYAPHVDQLNVRNLPSTKDTTVVDTLSQGTTVDVLEQKKDDQGRLWYKTNKGWIAAWLVSPVTTVSNRGIETNDGSLNIQDTSTQADEPVWGDPSPQENEGLSDTQNDTPQYEPDEQIDSEPSNQVYPSDTSSDDDGADYTDPFEPEESHSQDAMDPSNDPPAESDPAEINLGDDNGAFDTTPDF